jgi:hypothetical protein
LSKEKVRHWHCLARTKMILEFVLEGKAFELSADNESWLSLTLQAPQWVVVTTSSLPMIAKYDRVVQDSEAYVLTQHCSCQLDASLDIHPYHLIHLQAYRYSGGAVGNF